MYFYGEMVESIKLVLFLFLIGGGGGGSKEFQFGREGVGELIGISIAGWGQI